MEVYKKDNLQVLLQRVKENNSERFVEALKNEKGEPQALHCYQNSHQMMNLQNSFGECMLRDGCFIIELFRRNVNREEYKDFSHDKLFNLIWIGPRLRCDMILFENQIPLFVLRALFALTEKRPDTDRDFPKLALRFFYFNGEPIPGDEIELGPQDDIPHLLGLLYKALVVGKRKANSEQETPKQQNNYNARGKSWEPIRTAVALKQVGVTFVKTNDNFPFHDIGFSGGELSIPRLVIDDGTECLFRNLVAYEQYSENCRLHRVVDYLKVMDCLINSSEDAKLLRHRGIIDNSIGDDEKVSDMFNRLLSGVRYNPMNSFYTDMLNDVNKFCENPWNKRIAKLKTEYFSSPWSVISFLAAVLLLLLTVTQTVYAVLSYHHPKI
ncbi:hypothetical protein TIFTF001_023907 [Ficus carica]|uniref:Uncharacterized protein n=1 Tax=Ficus carica TaxID=3494 RepID=A0AA88DE93_FICCA|nr:hypothetical protein TIFTF001_023907 [Ficus carica]